MPRYQHAQTFDIVRSVRGAQNDIRSLQVQNAGVVRKSLNSHVAAVNFNPFFWGMDDSGWNATAGTFIIVSDPPDPTPYPYAGLYLNDSSGAGALMTNDLPFPVVPLQQYTVNAWVYSTVTSVQVGFDFQDGTHTPVTGPTNPTITITANTWTPVQASLIAPANAVFAYPRVGSPSGDGAQTYIESIAVVPTSGNVFSSPIATVQPGSSPAIAETWHDLPAGINSWGIGAGGWKKYRLTADGDLGLSISLRTIGTKTDGTALFSAGALPTGYQVSVARRLAISITTNALSANSTPWIGLLADGSLNINGVNVAGLNQVDLHGVFPLI